MTTVAAEAPASPPLPFREVWLISAGRMMTHWYPAAHSYPISLRQVRL
jgi:hypothetical protein